MHLIEPPSDLAQRLHARGGEIQYVRAVNQLLRTRGGHGDGRPRVRACRSEHDEYRQDVDPTARSL
jgi:hypothetical protein